MSRSYRHISDYEREILQFKAKGETEKEIAGKLGFSFKQIHNFLYRYRTNQKKIAVGVALKTKGRPPKDYTVSDEAKISELKYIIARKDARIKRLEMETELMRDFLSLTGRK